MNWGGVATRRFQGTDPALQALDFVLQHGGLTDDEKTDIQSGFPITTLDRLLSTPAVRDAIGVEVKSGTLLTGLPQKRQSSRYSGSSAIWPLGRLPSQN